MKTRKYVVTVTVADDAPSDAADYSEMESSWTGSLRWTRPSRFRGSAVSMT
jgi:hypothetical protein